MSTKNKVSTIKTIEILVYIVGRPICIHVPKNKTKKGEVGTHIYTHRYTNPIHINKNSKHREFKKNKILSYTKIMDSHNVFHLYCM